MATHAVPRTVTLSGSFTTGSSGGLLPAAPTNRIQDFPLPNNFTPAGEKLNLKIIAVLAAPLGVAVLVILVEMFFCYRWKARTKKLSEGAITREPDSYLRRRRIVGPEIVGPSTVQDDPVSNAGPEIYELSGSVTNQGIGHDGSVSWSLERPSPHSTSDEGSRATGSGIRDRMRIGSGDNSENQLGKSLRVEEGWLL